MAYPSYLREKARQLRVQKKLTIDELAERLALSRSTIYYWVRDLPIERDHERMTLAARRAARANRRKAEAARNAAYQAGRAEFAQLSADPSFRDFVCMYIGEGYKRNRNRVSIGNSNPAVVRLATHWIRKTATNRIRYALQYHADQKPEELIAFWSRELGAVVADFYCQRKSNSGQLNGRAWRSRYGICTVCVHDTMLRARVQAWMDLVEERWPRLAANGA